MIQQFRGASEDDIECASVMLGGRANTLRSIWAAIGADCQVLPGPYKFVDLEDALSMVREEEVCPIEDHADCWPVAMSAYRSTFLCMNREGGFFEVPIPGTTLPAQDFQPREFPSPDALLNAMRFTLEQGLEVWDRDHEMFVPPVRPPGLVRKVLVRQFGVRSEEVWLSTVRRCVDTTARTGAVVVPGLFSIECRAGTVHVGPGEAGHCGSTVYVDDDMAAHEGLVRDLRPVVPRAGEEAGIVWPGIGEHIYIAAIDQWIWSCARSLEVELRIRSLNTAAG